MKKTNCFLLAVVVILLSISLFACDNMPVVLAPAAEVIAIPGESFDSVADLLILLDSQEKITLEYSSDLVYGMMIISIKGQQKELISDPAASTFISIYLSTDDIAYIDATITPVIYDGTTFYSSAMGVSSLPVLDGVAYLLCTVTFGENWTSVINEDAFILLE